MQIMRQLRMSDGQTSIVAKLKMIKNPLQKEDQLKFDKFKLKQNPGYIRNGVIGYPGYEMSQIQT